jgi:uncharacterized protein (TIRG00374 family)
VHEIYVDGVRAMAWVKRGLALAAFAVVLYLFWPLVKELRAAAGLFVHAAWGWLAVAVLLQVLSYTFLTGLNALLLRPFHGRISFGRLMAILPAIAFIEVAIPSTGASGVVLRARFLGRSGYSVEASTFTLALESIYLAVVMVAASLSGLWYLIRHRQLGPAQLIFLSALAIFLVALGLLVYWFGRDRERARRLAPRLMAYWNRLAARLGQPPYAVEDANARVDGFYDGLHHLSHTPRWPFLLTSLGRVALDVATLGACFVAFRYRISPGILLTGYSLTLLLSGLAALPGGLGLADASLAVIYARLGAPGAVAVAAALVYRLIAFWLLRFLGFVTWQFLEAQK